MIQIPGLCTMYVFCVLILLLSSVDCPLSVPMPPIPASIARTAVQNVTSTSTQHSARQLALHKHLLALLSIPYTHQIITSLFFLPHLFHVSVKMHCFLRERSGRRQQPCGAEPCAFCIEPHKVPPGTRSACLYSSFCFRR